jgi:hypothetical protein
VRVPNIPGTALDAIHMYFDNPAAAAGANPAGVWGPSAHNLVHHLEETAGQHLDSATADGAANDSTSVDVQAPQGNAPGQINGADLFSAASADDVQIPDHAVLDVGSAESFTVEAWIRTTTTGAFQHIVSKENDGPTGVGFDLMVWSSNVARFTVFDNAVGGIATAQAVVVTDGNWHHVVGRWDRATATAQLFVDGFVQNTATDPALAGSSLDNAQPFVIGEEGDSSPGFNFDGTIDEVRFSKQLRSNDWIRAQYLSMTDAYVWFESEAGQCNYRSIGTRFNYGTGEAVGNGTTLTATQGSRSVTGTGGTLWRTHNRGRGDAILIELVPYTIAAVNSETQLTLTTPYAGTTGGSKSYSIQRMFGTLQQWEDCIDGLGNGGSCPFFAPASNSLVDDNRGEVGIAYNDSPVPANADFTASVLIDGSITDEVRDITLTADFGNTNRGLAGAGAQLDNSNSVGAVRIQDDHVTVSWFEIRGGLLSADGVSVGNLNPANRIRLHNLLIHDVAGNGIQLTDPDAVLDVVNSIIYSPSSRGILIAAGPLSASSRIRLLNNTIYNATSSQGIESFEPSNPTVLLRNNIAITTSGANYNVPNPAGSSSDNLSGDASATSVSPGGGAEPSIPLSSVDFVNFNPANANLHLSAVSYARDKAATLSALFPGDIDGGPRLAPWDIGADEYGVTTEVQLQSFVALPGDASVRLEWRTASELRNLGFHLYRGSTADGPWTRLTSSMIPGLGSSAIGQAYAFADGGLQNGTRYFYRLEDVDASSRRTSHGPVSAVPQAGAGAGVETGGDGRKAKDEKGEGAASCPAWVLAAHGSSAGQEAPASLRCTRHGNPEAVSLELLSRDARSATLELRTGGFYALHEPTGTVRVFVPGFDFPQDEKAPALPIRRALTDAVVGRSVRLAGARALDLASFKGLVPAALGKAEMRVGQDGTVHAARRPARATGRTFPRSELATLLPSQFQGETKSAVVEIAPLRFDAQRLQLVLAKRVRFKLLFTGRETGESGRGSQGRAPSSRRRAASGEVLARLFTTSLGLHRVSFEQLFPGRRRGVTASQLRLERQGEPVAFHVEPAGNTFGPGGRLYFYADRTASSTDFSSELAYSLVSSSDGLRMATHSAAPGSGGTLAAPFASRSFETNRFYQPGLLDAPDPWLWEAVASGATRMKPVSLSGVSGPGRAELDVFLQGASESGRAVDHHVSVAWNGTPVGEAQFAGKAPYRMSLSLDASLLREGANELSLTNVADTGVSSLVFLDRVSLAHPQAASLASGAFEGTWAETGTATLSELTSLAALVELTETADGAGALRRSARWLTGYAAGGGSLRFHAEAGRSYLALGESALLRPRVATPEPSTLRATTNQADYILIAPRAFLTAAEPLLARRQDQGLAARAVAFEDIASEFGHGRPSAEAIRGFLAFAFHSWQRPSARYVVLLGDANYDPRNFIGSSPPAPLPALWTKTSYLWTVSDPQLVAVNGDDTLPDIAIGRLPAASVEQAQALVEKLLAWEGSGQGLAGTAALVADDPDLAGDFDSDIDDIRASYLAARGTRVLKLSERGAALRPSILDALNGGLSFLNYVGHGGAAVWASENVWNSWDAESLQAQSQQPLLVTMNCLNGYFVAPAFESLSESLIKADGRGAIAAFSPSGLSLDGPAHQYHRALMAELTSTRHETLGDAVLAAQKTYADSGLMPELLGIYHLLGDPATRIH